MPRIPRGDGPSTWHHLMNRAIGRRTLFETKQDFRYFLSRLALEVRRGAIEIHAYCLMGTHFHLLVRSLTGDLAEVMQRVQLAYSRWFNRSRGRDGSLVRGRYLSKLVDSLEYRRVLVRYIDHNPCATRLIERAAEYPWCSAYYYARGKGPRWLERSWIEAEVTSRASSASYRPEDYAAAFPEGGGLAELVESRLRHGGGPDELDNLVLASSERMRQWMRSRALLADGTLPGLPVLTLRHLSEALAETAEAGPTISHDGVERAAGEVALVGIGRDLCGALLRVLAERAGTSETTARRLYREHSIQMARNEEYATWATAIARTALAKMRGWRR